MARSRLIVIGPVPPPTHGVAISTSLVLANARLRERFEVVHLDTTDRRSRENIGRWDVTNVRLGLTNLGRLLRLLTGPAGIVYLPISQNVPAFLRDSLFISAAKLRGWKVAAHLRGSELRDVYANAPPPFRLWLSLNVRRIDSVAVMGESVRCAVDGLVDPRKIAVVPNGAPDLTFNGQRRGTSAVLFLSNLLRRKGVRESVEAALLVVARHPRARFLFAGSWEDESLERELRTRAALAGDRIRFLGPVGTEEKHRLLLTSAVLLFPPVRPEGHPRVVVEALAAGLPVVTTDRGTIAETVGRDGSCAVLIDDPVPEELALRVLDLLRDSEKRERMGDAARSRYLSEFTQERADARLVEWLTQVEECRGH